MLRTFATASLFVAAHSHGAMTQPRSRNAIDGGVAPWNGSVPTSVPFMFWCAAPDASSSDDRKVSGQHGQACFWFNNGCDISCEECDGQTGQVVHPRFIYNGTGEIPSWGGNGILPDPKQKSAVPKGSRPDGSTRLSICANPKRNATICDKSLRTMNVDADCGSPEDVTYYAPWRYPGAAPVIDSCGVAGGVYQWQHAAKAGGDYHPTVNAVRGDMGSELPKAPSGTVWTAGETVEVAWTHKAWHGGGYSYRLCPAGNDLNEDCFQAHPLAFADGTSALRWGGAGVTKKCEIGEFEDCLVSFTASDASGDLVLPKNSTWRKCPIPRAPWAWASTGASFPPVCHEPEACSSYHGPKFSGPGCGNDTSSCATGAFPCQCSGWGIGDLFRLEIVDRVVIPKDLAPGEWVLGWRWDCEESTQVWASCSDVTIKAATSE